MATTNDDAPKLRPAASERASFHHRRKRGRGWWFGLWLRLMVVGFLVGSLLVAGLFLWVYLKVAKDLPDVSELRSLQPIQASVFYASNGEPLGQVYSVYRKWVPISRIPKHLQDATVAIEDRTFYDHPGISLRGVVRALWRNVRARSIQEGASTITMQLARSLFLTREKTIERKLKEVILAIRIERQFSKEEILEFYLNQVCYGHGAFGVQAAANLYYGKDVRQLTLPQCALLAGLPKRPSYYSPYENKEACKRRRDLVLDKMVDAGFISKQEAEEAKKTPITDGLRPLKDALVSPMRAHWFTNHAIKELIQKFGADIVYKGGLKVYTTLDLRLQRIADQVVKRHVQKNRWRGVNQMALVCLEVKTGRIRAMVGGANKLRWDPKEKQWKLDWYNRATQAYRQPGSSMKIYVYAAALEFGFRPESVVNDSPITFIGGNGKVWKPKNYGGRYWGNRTLMQALAESNNVVAVKLCKAITFERVIEMAQRLGVRFGKNPYEATYSIALGSIGITPLSHTSAASCIPNGGMRVEPTCIAKVYDNEGNLIYEHKPAPRPVLDPKVAEDELKMLLQAVERGTGRRARLTEVGYQVAGKTGTSDEFRNAWFVGFTPHLSCGVWAGRENNKPMSYGSAGGVVCAPVFHDFMVQAVKLRPGEKMFAFQQNHKPTTKPANRQPAPSNTVTISICNESGLVATKYCPITHKETFERGEAPFQKCDFHYTHTRRILICTASGELAGFHCPEETIVVRNVPEGEIPAHTCSFHRPAVPTPDSASASPLPDRGNAESPQSE